MKKILVVFIILLLSVIVTVLFIPRYPIEHYSDEEIGAANKWGGIPKTEEDYEKMEAELIKQKEIIRKKDDEIKKKMEECKKENKEMIDTLNKKAEESEKNEKEALKEKTACENKSLNNDKEAADAVIKLEKLERKFKEVEGCCENEKNAQQELKQQSIQYQTEISSLKLQVQTLLDTNKKLDDSNKFLQSMQGVQAQGGAATAAVPVGPRPAPADTA